MSNFKKILDILKEDTIFEMATLSPKDHNLGVDIKLHILQPGDKQLSHGPIIKCLKSNNDKNFSISLNVDKHKNDGSYWKL